MLPIPPGSSLRPPVVGRLNGSAPARRRGDDPCPPSPRPPETRRAIFARGFSLVEMLVVMAIILLIIGLGVPAFNSIKGSKDITASAYDIAGTLEQARTYAMANRTYVWVGFFEEDGSQASAPLATPGVGRVVLCVVASKDGTRYRDASTSSTNPRAFYAFDPSTTPTNPVKLVQLNKLIRLDNTHLVAANVGRTGVNSPDRPNVDADYQVGDPQTQSPSTPGPFATHYVGSSPTPVVNPTTFGYPVGTTTVSTPASQYTFAKIIELNPQGEASKIVDNVSAGYPAWMEIAVVPARGNAVDPRYAGAANANKSAAVVQVGGLNGRVRIFRP